MLIIPLLSSSVNDREVVEPLPARNTSSQVIFVLHAVYKFHTILIANSRKLSCTRTFPRERGSSNIGETDAGWRRRICCTFILLDFKRFLLIVAQANPPSSVSKKSRLVASSQPASRRSSRLALKSMPPPPLPTGTSSGNKKGNGFHATAIVTH